MHILSLFLIWKLIYHHNFLLFHRTSEKQILGYTINKLKYRNIFTYKFSLLDEYEHNFLITQAKILDCIYHVGL